MSRYELAAARVHAALSKHLAAKVECVPLPCGVDVLVTVRPWRDAAEVERACSLVIALCLPQVETRIRVERQGWAEWVGDVALWAAIGVVMGLWIWRGIR